MAAQWPEDSAGNSGPGIGSAAIADDDTVVIPDFDFFDVPQRPVGDAVDAEIVGEESQSRLGKRRSRLKSDGPELQDRDAKATIPSIDEWMHFFSHVVIRVLTDFYIERAFRGIDDELLTDKEIDKIHLSREDRERIGRPFAEYANKLKFTRKHGRMIIASADSIDALLMFGLWFSRVNRIAAKYSRYRGTGATRQRQDRPPAPIFVPQERQQYEEQEQYEDVSSGPGENAQQNGHEPHWRPDIRGQVFNPNLG